MVELQEENFIKGVCEDNSRIFRFWAILVAFTILLIYGFNFKADKLVLDQLKSSPFLRVTNRQFSLFLWQHPQFMRVHAKNKIGYLPGFQYLHKVNMELEFAEDYVVAPPDILFHYHTWNRLLSSYIHPRAISTDEFIEFLNALNEWQPGSWVSAPKNYVELMNGLNELKNQNLENLLPIDVLQAFYGWKNFYKEGDLINAFNPTYKEMELFLAAYPHYARNYWQNIVSTHPNYLKSFTDGDYDPESLMPRDEVAPFLRVAMYNAGHT